MKNACSTKTVQIIVATIRDLFMQRSTIEFFSGKELKGLLLLVLRKRVSQLVNDIVPCLFLCFQEIHKKTLNFFGSGLSTYAFKISSLY